MKGKNIKMRQERNKSCVGENKPKKSSMEEGMPEHEGKKGSFGGNALLSKESIRKNEITTRKKGEHKMNSDKEDLEAELDDEEAEKKGENE